MNTRPTLLYIVAVVKQLNKPTPPTQRGVTAALKYHAKLTAHYNPPKRGMNK